jgi:hypothetical protein
VAAIAAVRSTLGMRARLSATILQLSDPVSDDADLFLLSLCMLYSHPSLKTSSHIGYPIVLSVILIQPFADLLPMFSLKLRLRPSEGRTFTVLGVVKYQGVVKYRGVVSQVQNLDWVGSEGAAVMVENCQCR